MEKLWSHPTHASTGQVRSLHYHPHEGKYQRKPNRGLELSSCDLVTSSSSSSVTMVSVETTWGAWEFGLLPLPGSNESLLPSLLKWCQKSSGESGLPPSWSRDEAMLPWCQWRPCRESELLPLPFSNKELLHHHHHFGFQQRLTEEHAFTSIWKWQVGATSSPAGVLSEKASYNRRF